MNTITMTLQADKLILEALREDISSEDVTTNAVMREAVAGEVDLICKQDGVIAGLEVFRRVFELLDVNTKVEFYCKDGDEVKNGQLMGKVYGDIRVLLSGERVALNYLQRMSGIATYTNSVVQLLKGSRTKLLDTRKTTPNMRIFEKYAVRVGGGYNHRYNLSDGVLLKDNHIGAAGSVTKAVQMAKDYAPFVRKIEVEVETLEQVREAVEAGVEVQTLPGATAFVPALVSSGLPTDRFCFEGFLPQKKGRMTRLTELSHEPRTMIIYESPRRIVKTLEQLEETMGGDRHISACREISKLHEESVRGTVSEVLAHFRETEPRGEFVIIIEGSTKAKPTDNANNSIKADTDAPRKESKYQRKLRMREEEN